MILSRSINIHEKNYSKNEKGSIVSVSKLTKFWQY